MAQSGQKAVSTSAVPCAGRAWGGATIARLAAGTDPRADGTAVRSNPC